MSLEILHSFLEWISQNAIWSGIIIFLIACSESLALVGLLVPGAVLMFALGTLITTGHLSFWPAVSWAVAGAIAGDAISYWLGYYYQDRLAKIWPLSRHPGLLDKGRRFFDKHGGKSVLLGRFFGPLRPIVPAIAGMTAMPLQRFFLINIISGILWGPLYLLPGMAFGLSLTLAGEVAGRLVVAILILLVSILFLLWIAKRVYLLLLPRVDRMLFLITNWSRKHPVAGHIPDALIKPEHPEVRVLSLLALLLFITSSLFVVLTQLTGENSLLQQVDRLFQLNMSAIRTPWFDRIMLAISGWSSTPGMLLVSLFTAAWLFSQKKLFTLWHLLAAVILVWLFSRGLPLIFTQPDIRLPAGSVMHFTAVMGFIAIAMAREAPRAYHMLVYSLAASLVFLNSFAVVYLQQNSFSEVLGGVSLGSVWVAIVGIAYRRHVRQPFVNIRSQLIYAALLLFFLLAIIPTFPKPALIQTAKESTTISLQIWQAEQWQQQSIIRKDIRVIQNHPLNLQWTADLSEIKQQLLSRGWQEPVSAQSLNLLQWFNPNPADKDLPLLPQVHAGQYDVLRLVRFAKGAPEFVRLWHSGVNIEVNGQLTPLWLGSVGRLYRQKLMGLTMFRTSEEYQQVPEKFIESLKDSDLSVLRKKGQLNGNDIAIFLIH